MQQTGDPFTREIIKESLIAIGEEMFVTTQRTSMSTIIYEVLDFAVGLTDAQGRLITQGAGVTLFLGTLTFAVQEVVRRYANDLHPGDIIITNDPYTGGGTHLSDVSLIAPIFYEGHLVAFAANKGHWTEVGGMAPGSWTTDATEIYQEGLQFPPLKLFEQGKPVDSLIDMIRANVRTPEMSIGDMYAQIASLRIAERRFHELCGKYGPETVLHGIEYMLDHSEALVRQELAKLPDGMYETVDYIDDDGIGNGPFEVRVRVTLKGDRMICDFTGSHPQVPGPINCSRTGLHSAVTAIVKAIAGPDIVTNDGCFRPIEIICPDRTIFTCERPAPVSTYWETMLYAADLVWKAMAPLVPDRLPAGHFLSVCGTVVAGIHPDTNELFILVEPQAGGWGASAARDGEHGLVSIGDGETFVIPVEVCETRYGVMVDQFALHTPDGGGAGRQRGGRGLVRDYRITAESATFTGTYGRFTYLPWGMAGGKPGSPNYFQVLGADGTAGAKAGKGAQIQLRKDDVVRLVTGTGGGYGDPAERSRAAIEQDLRDGYLTPEQARQDYGY